MQLVIDEFSEQLKTSLEDLTWGGIDETSKADLVKYVESHLHLYKHSIPPKKSILKRLKVIFNFLKNNLS